MYNLARYDTFFMVLSTAKLIVFHVNRKNILLFKE